MIKTIVIKTAISKDISDITSKKLSIQFSLDGFSFCLSNQKNKVYSLKEYSFSKTVSVGQCLKEIVTVFKNEETLQSDFESIFVIHQNYLNALVPNPFFDDSKLASYLKFSVKTLPTDTFAFDSIKNMSAKNVYIPYVNVNNFFFQNFGEFEFKHHATVLIEKLLATNTGEHVYVHISKNHLDIVVLQDKDLRFYNSFEYRAKEDAVYYILFTAEQLKLNPDEFSLRLLGDIEEGTDIYALIYTYIRNVSFLKNQHPLLTGSSDFTSHSNFILLG